MTSDHFSALLNPLPGTQPDSPARIHSYKAMDAFQKAVDLSEGENIRAVYDLALMHTALDEFDEALKLLDTMPAGRA